jgi:hypothetical protein
MKGGGETRFLWVGSHSEHALLVPEVTARARVSHRRSRGRFGERPGWCHQARLGQKPEVGPGAKSAGGGFAFGGHAIPEFRLRSPESGTENTGTGAVELVAQPVVGFLRHTRRLGNHRGPVGGLQLAHQPEVAPFVALDPGQRPGFQVRRLAGLEVVTVRRKIKRSHLTFAIGAGELPLPAADPGRGALQLHPLFDDLAILDPTNGAGPYRRRPQNASPQGDSPLIPLRFCSVLEDLLPRSNAHKSVFS